MTRIRRINTDQIRGHPSHPCHPCSISGDQLMSPATMPSPTRRPSDHVYYSMTKGLCGTCKGAVDAKIIFRDDAVYLDKFCPTHGKQECLIASSVEWYLDCLSF